MKVAIERRAIANAQQKTLVEQKVKLRGEAETQRQTGIKYAKLREIRVTYAAARIQGIIRGFLTRCHYEKLVQSWRAAITIQRILRGKLGKMAWKRALWLVTAVAKSPGALTELLKRSRVVRKSKLKGMMGFDWREMFDPLTDSYFYYEKQSGRNTWDCPPMLQNTLICTWNGITSYNSSTDAKISNLSNPSDDVKDSFTKKIKEENKLSNKKYSQYKLNKDRDLYEEDKDPQQTCRCVFKCLSDLHSHMRTAHRWYCPACDFKNPGTCFPVCTLCGNSRTADGDVITKSLAAGVKKIHSQLDGFLLLDKAMTGADNYSLRDRLMTLTAQRRGLFETICREDAGDDDDSAGGWVQDAQNEAITEEINFAPEEEEPDLMVVYNKMIASLHYTRAFPPDHTGGTVSTELSYSGPLMDTGPFINTTSMVGDPGTRFQNTDLEPRFQNSSPDPGSTFQDSYSLPSISNSSASSSSSGNVPKEHSFSNSSSYVTENSIEVENNFTRQKSKKTVYPTVILGYNSMKNSADEKTGQKKGAEKDPKKDPKGPKSGFSLTLPTPASRPMIRNFQEGDGSGMEGREGGYVYASLGALNPFMADMATPPVSDMRSMSAPTGNMFQHKSMRLGDIQEVGGMGGREGKEGVEGEEGTAEEEGEGDDVYHATMLTCKTITTISQANEYKKKGGRKAERSPFSNPLGLGVLFEEEMNEVLEGFSDPIADLKKLKLKRRMLLNKKEEKEEEDEQEKDDEITIGETTEKKKKKGAQAIVWRDNSDRYRMLVCQKFLIGKCTLTTCPLAHPGVRDFAPVTYGRPPGENKKLPLVSVCPDFDAFHDTCETGRLCSKYHVYVRPSTAEIIRAMYPLGNGRKLREYPSGAKIDGEYKEGDFNGFGIYTWPNNSTYTGDWREGKREGEGLYRSAGGLEYIGGWIDSSRHGLGVVTTLTGDEYAGEFHEGKMEGIGRLSSCNGDVYEGSFKNNRYHGLGSFIKYGGDTYMGCCEKGEACGLGILALNSGEKYKGYFDRNFRHGTGVCSYRNQSKYAGEWYRGVPQGFGVYGTLKGDRYVGQWAAGKKHGKGRYYFANGDFFDGTFFKNKAKGMGTYYHNNGNIYNGEWDNDQRNGRGTYAFQNGSKFTGNFVDNRIHGKGKFDFAVGCYYRGEFQRNVQHGRGTYTWINGATYKGTFALGKISGHGEMIYANYHRYVGAWAGNKKNGFGVFYYRRGHIYSGEWLHDIRQGKGKMTFFPSSMAEESYEGDWDKGIMHGEGRYAYRFDEGTVYTGSFIRGVRSGEGLLTYKDGSFYRGSFLKEQMWGRGVYVSKEGGQYDGDWQANMRHGEGTAVESDGSIYHGEYHMNMKHGQGTLQDADGGFFTGNWESNIPVGKGTFKMNVGKGAIGGSEEITVRVFAL